MLSGQGTEDIGKLLTSAVIPVILLNSLWEKKRPRKPPFAAVGRGVSLLMALSVALAALLFSRDGVSCFSAAFSNAGFIGSRWRKACWAAMQPF